MSSLYRRSDGSQLAETVQVHTVRLDKLLEAECLNRTAIALWIDTEGKSFEVITGAADILPVTRMLHVEVETRRVIGEEQRVFDEVVVLLESAGFVLLATDPPLHDFQFNALFLRRDSLHSKSFAVKFWVRALQLRRALSRAALRLVPLRLQRKLLFLTR